MSLVADVLFGYQQEAAQRIYEQRKVLLADQPGLGKTLEVLGALELDDAFSEAGNILILTPIINAQTTWRDTIERFIKPRYPDVNVVDVSKGTVKQKDKQFQHHDKSLPNIVLANHNALDMTKSGIRVAGIGELKYRAVIIDESHLVLPIRNKSLTNFWRGLMKVQMLKDCIRIAISGTPDRGKLENRYGTWLFLDIEDITANRWSWLENEFWIVEQRVSKTRTVRVPTELRDRDRWTARDRRYMIRRTKQEVLPQLPAKRYVDVEIELGKEQHGAYFHQQLLSSAKVGENESNESAEAMIFALRARQIAACTWDGTPPVPVVGGPSAKLDWLLEWLDERGFIEHDDMADNLAKVVIVSQFSKVLNWLKAELKLRGIDSAVLDGAASSGERDRIQREFQDRSSALRVVLLSGNMGVGITLDAADDLIMIDSPYDPDRIEQIEDRVHRASNMHSVTIWNLIALDTIDQAIAERVSTRYQTTREIMDGSRGVEFARKVIDIVKKEEVNV